MKRTKNFIVLLLTAVLAVLLCTLPLTGNARASAEGAEITAPAEGEEPPVSDGTDDEAEAFEERLKTLVSDFIEQLKAKYGDDYETYYNAIIAQWGSVEEYLLSLVNDKTPDAVAQGWTAFVRWLGEYSPVWGSIFAIVAVIIVVLLGKKALNKVTGFVTGTGGKFKTLFGEVNKIDAALSAQSEALIKLLGENEKFRNEREALKKTAEEITDDGKLQNL